MTNAQRGPDRAFASSGPSYDDGRLSAPAALRNRDAITQVLASLAPKSGQALEIASGTGEHVVRFAPAMPGLDWQPTDPSAERRASIAAWMAVEPAPNIKPPLDLDACAPGWSDRFGPVDLVFLANLLHLVSDDDARMCLQEIARALAPGGLVTLYGPFLRDGRATSEGDAAFDARIRSEIPGAGYKDVAWVEGILADAGLDPEPSHAMPANNLLLVARSPA